MKFTNELKDENSISHVKYANFLNYRPMTHLVVTFLTIGPIFGKDALVALRLE